MTQDSSHEAFPTEGLSLYDFARRQCRPEFEAWQSAEKKCEEAGGHLTIGEMYPRSITTSSYMNYGVSMTRRFAVEIKSERTKAIESANQTLTALKIAVRDIIKSGIYTLRGVPKGAHTSDDIWPPLFDKVLNIDLKGSIIVIAGKRRFDCVRVFQVQSKVPAPPPIAIEPSSPEAVIAKSVARARRHSKRNLKVRPPPQSTGPLPQKGAVAAEKTRDLLRKGKWTVPMLQNRSIKQESIAAELGLTRTYAMDVVRQVMIEPEFAAASIRDK